MSEFMRFLIFMSVILVVAIVFATITTWVHREYHRRHDEGRAPKWLYYLELSRSILGQDIAQGRPEPPKPNLK